MASNSQNTSPELDQTQVTETEVQEPQTQSQSQDGGKAHKKYNGRSYIIRKGSRGGKYILVKGKKIYV
jgi:hypothetical protein